MTATDPDLSAPRMPSRRGRLRSHDETAAMCWRSTTVVSGVPQYELSWNTRWTSEGPPAPLTAITQVRYDSATDTMFAAEGDLSGFSRVARFNNWRSSRTLAFPPLDLNFLYQNGSVNVVHNPAGAATLEFPAFDVAGDRLFVVRRWSPIYVFDANTGAAQTTLFPGPEVSGYGDWNHGIFTGCSASSRSDSDSTTS
jgi:hypothetical protein